MEIEWLMIADAAEVVGNKLYVLGGGWDRLTIRSGFPLNRQIGIALSFKVPWAETNERHQFEIEVATDDAESLHKAGGEIEVGRPPGIPPGADQRVQMAVTAHIQFKQAGQYVIIARVDGEDSKRVVFSVVNAADGEKSTQPLPDSA